MLRPAAPPGEGPPRKRGARWRAAVLLLAAAAGTSAPAAAGAVTTHRALPGLTAPNCDSGGQTLWDHLAACGWPGPTNTGPDLADCPGHQLTVVGDGASPIRITTPGATITCEDLRGLVYIDAPGVTITNSETDAKSGTGLSGSASITIEPGASATIDHVAVDAAISVHACIWHEGTQMTVRAVNCSGANDGIFTWAATGHSPTAGDDFTITDSYIHDLTQETANGHDDGYQTEGASHGLIEHNTFRMSTSATSAVAIWDSLKSSSDITVAGNLITGGGFSMYAEDYSPGDGAPGNPSPVGGYSVTDISFTGNVFSTVQSGCVGQYGVWFTRPEWEPYHGGPTDGWRREGNTVLETGEDIDSGNPHVHGELCR